MTTEIDAMLQAARDDAHRMYSEMTSTDRLHLHGFLADRGWKAAQSVLAQSIPGGTVPPEYEPEQPNPQPTTPTKTGDTE